MLLVHGDIELNLGPRKCNTCKNVSICHWNLNSIAAHNFQKVDFLEACNTVQKLSLICLSELYLDFSILYDNDYLITKVYKIIRDDYPDDIKRGRVCA